MTNLPYYNLIISLFVRVLFAASGKELYYYHKELNIGVVEWFKNWNIKLAKIKTRFSINLYETCCIFLIYNPSFF